ncbi:ATP-binding cassette domain-containing protein [Acidobacteriota bacterium]
MGENSTQGIRLENVSTTKTFSGENGESQSLKVLDNCSLSCPEGRVNTIIGPSGSGKSTLLRTINRLEDPDSGTILFNGRDIRDYPVLELRQRIGFVSQVSVMFPGSVEDNLRIAERLKVEHCEPCEALAPLLGKVGLDGTLLGRDGARLSVGQKQRVAIARALVCRPEVLLMDEPTSALDPATAESVISTVKDLSRSDGLTIIMVTHTMEIAKKIGDMTAVLMAGRIAQEGPTADIFGDGASPEVKAFLEGKTSA